MVLIIRSNRISRVPPYFSHDPLHIISTTGVSPSTLVFPKIIRLSYVDCCYVRFLQFRSSLLSESLLLSFPLATKIFQFARSRLHCWIHTLLVCGFAHSDSCGYVYLQLPAAFRRSSRPSSPSSAKASTVRPYFLNLTIKSFFNVFVSIYLLFKDLL